MGFFMRLRLREAPVGSYPTFSPLLAGLVVSGQSKLVGPRPNRTYWRRLPDSVSFFLLATENRLLTTSPAGGLFSVTLSVTRDSHPRYPRFHKACSPSVFGLSSGGNFTPAITCHSGKDIIETKCAQRSTFGALRNSFRLIQNPTRSPIELALVLVLVLGFSSVNGCRRQIVPSCVSSSASTALPSWRRIFNFG
jgi:hypothetical protein